MPEQTPLKTFFCYAHEDRGAVDGLRKHLGLLEKKQVLEVWEDGKILPGEEWDKSIKKQLESADLVLLFISVDFINSDYIEKTELQAALARHRAGETVIVPVIVRACDWAEYFEIGKFQALPRQARPIQSAHFPILDEAYHEVAQGIKSLAQGLLEKRQSAAAATREAAAEKNRAERLLHRDQTAWETAVAEANSATKASEKIAAYEVYLEDSAHTLHRTEAEKHVADLTSAETKRKIEEKKRAEVAEQKKEQEQTPVKKTRAFEDALKTWNQMNPHLINVFSTATPPLFPVHGVTLGKTTLAELQRLGTRASFTSPNSNEPYQYYVVQGTDFWYDEGLASRMYLTNTDPMPPPWQQIGFDWSLSYNEWLALFNRLGYRTEQVEAPKVTTYEGKPSFSAKIRAECVQNGIRYSLELGFNYSHWTQATDKNTLYNLRVVAEELP